MITQIKTLPNRYSENLILDSRVERHLKIQEGVKTLCTGGHIRPPKNLSKIAISERYGDVCIDRYFLQLENDKLIPIYVKIYGKDEANVLLFKKGISHARQLLAPKKDQVESKFLKDELFHHVVIALESLEPYVASEVADYTSTQHSAIMLINNDNHPPTDWHEIFCCSYNPTDIGNLVTNDSTNNGPEGRKTSYPWNIINTSTDDVRMELVDTRPNLIANHLHDLSIQVNMDMVSRRSSHPLFLHLDALFSPYLGEAYEPIAYDPLSKASILSSEIDIKMIKNTKATSRLRSHDSYIKINNRQFNEVERVTSFSSQLLELCVIIHEYPIHEFYFNYILPTKNKRESVNYSGVTGKNYINHENVNYFMHVTLPEVLRAWNYHPKEITIIKTGDEEMIICVKDEKQTKQYYIDLFMTTLLSQSIFTPF